MSEALYRIREKGNARTLYRGDTVLAFESGTPQADSELILVCDYLNQETAKLQAEIASLQAALADLLAAAEVRSEELGKARNYIRELAVVDFTGNDTRLNGMAIWRNRAQALAASWKAKARRWNE